MSIQEKHAALIGEAKALKYFYNIHSNALCAAFAAYAAAYTSPTHVEPEVFTTLLNAIDAALEDICIVNGICQEVLDELMAKDPQFENVTI